MAQVEAKRPRIHEPWYLSQEQISSELLSMLPELKPKQVPVLDDLLNESPFVDFRKYFFDKGEYCDSMPPDSSQLEARPQIEKALGLQLGAIHSRHHTGQLVEPGSGK